MVSGLGQCTTSNLKQLLQQGWAHAEKASAPILDLSSDILDILYIVKESEYQSIPIENVEMQYGDQHLQVYWVLLTNKQQRPSQTM